MAKAKKTGKTKKKPIDQYDHKGKKRVNNPPVGLVTPQTDKECAPLAIIRERTLMLAPRLLSRTVSDSVV